MTDQPVRVIPLLILIGIGLGLGYNAVQSEPVPWIGTEKATIDLENLETPAGETPQSEDDPSAASGIPESEFPITVSLEKSKELYDGGFLTVLDARELHEYEEGHIKGAIPAPYDDVGGDPDWLEEMAAKKTVFLIYCGGGDCELSINLGFAISQAGHRRVCVFEEGYPAWKEAGFPVATGAQP